MYRTLVFVKTSGATEVVSGTLCALRVMLEPLTYLLT